MNLYKLKENIIFDYGIFSNYSDFYKRIMILKIF